MTDISPLNYKAIMDGWMMRLWFVVLCASWCAAAPDNLLVLVGSAETVQRGGTATLPCWLNAKQSAEHLEVRWYRGDGFDTPIMLYQDRKYYYRDPLYVGRVSFGVKDAVSGGLQDGDVSLKLMNVTIEDEGGFTCYVSSQQVYDSATITLHVTETGSAPRLSPVWQKEDNKVNVSCDSKGWYPQPVLRWSDETQDLIPDHLVHSNDSSGLYFVHSWVVVSTPTEISCSVGLPNKEPKVAHVRLEYPPQGSSAAGWTAFGIVIPLMVLLAALGALCLKKKGYKVTRGKDHSVENAALLSKGVGHLDVLPTLRNSYANITPENTGNSFVTIKGCKLRDAQRDDFPDGGRVTCLTAVKGRPGFSGGKHYWEVSLGNVEGVGLKQSWWIGVTNAAAEIPQDVLFSPNTSNGFWFLSSSRDAANRFQFSSEPKVTLPVHVRPQTVGVYLDYDGGELSFYNVEDSSLIGSLAARFRGEVFPFFNPGKGDKAPMEIIQRTE